MLPIKRLTISVILSLFAVFFSVVPSFAASAFVVPASGIIKQSTFKVSVFIESTSTEPAITAANVKLNYPSNVSVSKIEEGDFDTMLEKSNEPTTRVITLNAVNNAGNYKTGKVKLASIDFTTNATSGAVNLNINAAESSISGENGNQLLTDNVNGVFTIQITPSNLGGGGGEDPEETTPTGTGTGTTTTSTTDEVPETGIKENFLIFIILSVGLMGMGLLTLKPKVIKE